DAVRSVLDELTWEAEGFALAEGFDETTGKYVGLTIPHRGGFGQISDATLLVLPALALQQLAEERPAPEVVVQGGGDGGDQGTIAPLGGGTPPEPVNVPPPPQNVHFFGVMRLNPERYGRDLTRIAQEVLQHLAAVDGATLEVTVEIRATKPDGFPDD